MVGSAFRGADGDADALAGPIGSNSVERKIHHPAIRNARTMDNRRSNTLMKRAANRAKTTFEQSG
jgi:hypothetical protein